MSYPLSDLLLRSSVFDYIPTKKEEQWRFSPLDTYLDKKYHTNSVHTAQKHIRPDEDYWITIEDANLVEVELPPSVHVKFTPLHLELNCFEDIEIYVHIGYSENIFVDHTINVIVQEHVNVGLYYCYEGAKQSFVIQSGHIKLEPYAQLSQTQVEDLSSEAAFIMNNSIHLDRHSSFKNFSLLQEGEYIHNFVHADLHYHSKADITALLLSRNAQKSIFSCTVDHLADKSISNIRSKQIVRDQSVCVFDANTKITKETKATQAKQTSRALLLGEKAHVHSKPHLEIYSDDLSASHGSTVGELDQAALSYLQSRGICEEKAKAVLISAFIHDLIEYIGKDRDKERILKQVERSHEPS